MNTLRDRFHILFFAWHGAACDVHLAHISCQALSKSSRVECPLEHLRRVVAHMLFFNAATQFAFTTTSFPKAIFLPAFVAGLLFFFSMHKPGMVNLPVLFTSFVATTASFSNS